MERTPLGKHRDLSLDAVDASDYACGNISHAHLHTSLVFPSHRPGIAEFALKPVRGKSIARLEDVSRHVSSYLPRTELQWRAHASFLHEFRQPLRDSFEPRVDLMQK